jgi:monothiol glutaredoxin
MNENSVKVAELVRSQPVVLLMKGTPQAPMCGFSAQVCELLHHLDVPFGYGDVLADPDLRQMAKGYANWPTFPQLYVKGEFVGGCDIAMDMFRSGELQKMLQDAGIKAATS